MNLESLPLNKPKIPSPWMSTYFASNWLSITVMALMKYV